MITQNQLKKLFSYNPETGKFTRLVTINYRAKAGDVVKAIDSQGYIGVSVENKRYTAHRLIWIYVYGVKPDHIDHINGIRTDNRLVNLRSVAQKENCKNLSVRKDNASGVMGVSFFKRDGTWQVRVSRDGKYIHLGYFADKFEAICARKSAEIKCGYHKNHGKV